MAHLLKKVQPQVTLFQPRSSHRILKKSTQPESEVLQEAESRLIEDFDEPISRYQGKLDSHHHPLALFCAPTLTGTQP